MNKIKDKISEIEKFLAYLKEMTPSSIEEYKSDIKTRSACERIVEKIVEAMVDLAFLVIKSKKFDIPQDDIDAFRILMNKGVISKELALKLGDAKGMRNIIAHEYSKIDDDIVFHSITEELEDDAKEFIDTMKNLK